MNDNDDDDDNFNRRNIIQFYNCFDFSMLLLCVSAHTHHVYKCVFFFSHETLMSITSKPSDKCESDSV